VTDLSGSAVSDPKTPRRAVAVQPWLSRAALPVLLAASLVLLVPDWARAAPAFASESPPVDARLSLPSGSGPATPVVAVPTAIGFGSRLPFGRLDVALLLIGSLALACLASGALRLLWYRPVPTLVDTTSLPALPVMIGGDTVAPQWAQGLGPG
jgi:hypothetical protein